MRQAWLDVTEVRKQSEGRAACVERIKSRRVELIIDTPLGVTAQKDGLAMRTAAVAHGVPRITALSGSAAAVEALQGGAKASVTSLQQMYADRLTCL